MKRTQNSFEEHNSRELCGRIIGIPPESISGFIQSQMTIWQSIVRRISMFETVY
jgi:hypothetical protein